MYSLKIPTLSIYVATYNHEHYITQALDSILMQKTQYTYEVLVGEDCSTDNTRAVLKAYEEQHPDKFSIFYRDHNMYHETPSNAMDLKLRCRGKYIIALEGDDYWTDCFKIEKQISFLESHPDYIAVAHNCIVVDHDSRQKNETYPECKDIQYSYRHYLSEILPGQLATVMYRNIFKDNQYDTSLLHKQLTPGDRVTYFWLLANGKIHCMQEKMSAYRHVTDQGSSFSATHKYCFGEIELLYDSLLQYAKSTNNSEALSVAQDLYFRQIMHGLKNHQCSFDNFCHCIRKISHKPNVFIKYIIYKIRKDILHLQFWA